MSIFQCSQPIKQEIYIEYCLWVYESEYISGSTGNMGLVYEVFLCRQV